MISVYLWAVVYSFYKELQESMSGGRVYAASAEMGQAGGYQPAYNKMGGAPQGGYVVNDPPPAYNSGYKN